MASVSLAWGSSYLLMKVCLNSIAPFNLIALRFGIAFVCMTVVFFSRFRRLNRKTFGKGVLMGAFFYAIYILVLDKIAKNDDTLLISIIQLGGLLYGEQYVCCFLKLPHCRKLRYNGVRLFVLGLFAVLMVLLFSRLLKNMPHPNG